MNRLSELHQNGRRFVVSEAVERDSTVVLGLTISQPDWLSPVEVFKVFRFGPSGDKVVLMQDCESRNSALAMLGAG